MNKARFRITELQSRITIDARICGIVSGILLGLASFLIKITVSIGILNIAFFINPITWIAAILAIAGFVLMQKAFYAGSVSTAITTIAGLSIVIPTTLAYLFLAESINPVGIALILLGVLILGLSKKH
ncbi:MAG: hypothetical protein HZB65_00845 [Candidatus Aenigmarchaeota archaeon]|nr:hypothetical protein [Candidatus Aenigmarchaeota archaeon]